MARPRVPFVTKEKMSVNLNYLSTGFNFVMKKSRRLSNSVRAIHTDVYPGGGGGLTAWTLRYCPGTKTPCGIRQRARRAGGQGGIVLPAFIPVKFKAHCEPVLGPRELQDITLTNKSFSSLSCPIHGFVIFPVPSSDSQGTNGSAPLFMGRVAEGKWNLWAGAVGDLSKMPFVVG